MRIVGEAVALSVGLMTLFLVLLMALAAIEGSDEVGRSKPRRLKPASAGYRGDQAAGGPLQVPHRPVEVPEPPPSKAPRAA